MRTTVALVDATHAFAATPVCGGPRVPAPHASRADGDEPSSGFSAGAFVAALLIALTSLASLSLMDPPRAQAAEITGKSHGGDAPPVHPRSDSADGDCLSRQEQRAGIAARTVVPLAKAARAVKGRRDTLLNARLCERDGRLVYLLTVLARGGKVLRAAVDAGSGTLIHGPH
jgi:uncharacterized membrane protein YkoI